MKLPILEHSGLYITTEFLSGRPPAPVRLEHVDTVGQGPEPDYERLREMLLKIQQEFAEPATSDGMAAKAIHQCLPLTRREAADMRFWHYLSAVQFPDYVCWRYYDSRTGKTNRNRYTGLLDDNALARLWWFADLTFSIGSADPYWRTIRTATSLVFIKGVVENLFGGNRWLVNGLADALFNGQGKPPDTLVEQVFTRANVLLVSIAIDALGNEDIHQIVQQLCNPLEPTRSFVKNPIR